MNILFFDTETTGLCDFKAASNAPHQPRPVELALLLCSDARPRLPLAELVIKVKPLGFSIPEEAARVHGITTAEAQAGGINADAAVMLFLTLADQADLLVAYNADFDRIVMENEIMRVFDGKMTEPDPFTKLECLMKRMIPVCAIPSTKFRNEYKWPSMKEAHWHAFATGFGDAHSAMADAYACRDVWFWLEEQGRDKKVKESP